MLKPSRYRIIAIGKIRKDWIQKGINLYLKRLPGLVITEIRDSDLEKEAISIQSSIQKNELLIVLDEKGEHLNSLEFCSRLNTLNNHKLVFVIGGANGLSPQIKDMANLSLSLSLFTFPHEIARLLLLEQIFRAMKIKQGSPYHRA